MITFFKGGGENEEFFIRNCRNRLRDFYSRHWCRRFRKLLDSFRNDRARRRLNACIGIFLAVLLSAVPRIEVEAVESYISADYIELAEKYAEQYSVSPYLIVTFIEIESSGHADAVSPTGQYIGLMQLNSETFEGDLTDPANNIEQGTKYLSDLLEEHSTVEAVSLYSGEGGRHGYYTEKVMFQLHKKIIMKALGKELAKTNFYKETKGEFEL